MFVDRNLVELNIKSQPESGEVFFTEKTRQVKSLMDRLVSYRSLLLYGSRSISGSVRPINSRVCPV